MPRSCVRDDQSPVIRILETNQTPLPVFNVGALVCLCLVPFDEDEMPSDSLRYDFSAFWQPTIGLSMMAIRSRLRVLRRIAFPLQFYSWYSDFASLQVVRQHLGVNEGPPDNLPDRELMIYKRHKDCADQKPLLIRHGVASVVGRVLW